MTCERSRCLRSFERFSGSRYCPLCSKLSFACFNVMPCYGFLHKGRCPYFDATIHHSGLMAAVSVCDVLWLLRAKILRFGERSARAGSNGHGGATAVGTSRSLASSIDHA